MTLKRLPKFSSDESAANWFDTHDTADYMDGMEELPDKVHVIRTVLRPDSQEQSVLRPRSSVKNHQK